MNGIGFSTNWDAWILSKRLSVSKKSSNGWAFSHVDGKINMGDERCWNAGNWIEIW